MMIARTRAITAGPEQTCGSHSSAFATNITVHPPQQSKERQLPVLVAAHWLLLNRRKQMPSYGSGHELKRVQGVGKTITVLHTIQLVDASIRGHLLPAIQK